ncbi:hypothetical protein ACWGQT_31340, partial [Streptomyces yangpuensis]
IGLGSVSTLAQPPVIGVMRPTSATLTMASAKDGRLARLPDSQGLGTETGDTRNGPAHRH